MKNNFFMLRLVWKVCPGRVLAEFGVQVAGYMSWVFYSIYFLKYILTAMMCGVAAGTAQRAAIARNRAGALRREATGS